MSLYEFQWAEHFWNDSILSAQAFYMQISLSYGWENYYVLLRNSKSITFW